MSKKKYIFAIEAAVIILIIGCILHTRNYKQSHAELFTMDTIISLTTYGADGQEAVDEATKEINRLNSLWSVGSPNSEISQINDIGGGKISPDTASLLQIAITAYQQTDGLFDFTIYPLMELWGFTSQEYHVPEQREISALLSTVDGSSVTVRDDHAVTLAPGQKIDLGGIAKGYASARIMEIFRKHGIKSALVSLGGNIQTLGRRPDGKPWRVGIQDPNGTTGEYLAVLSVKDKAVITSGGYERYFIENNRTYIHILDPRTGYPADSDLLSVTVISEDGAKADALSTALYIMGREKAVDYWKAHASEFDLVLIDDTNVIYATDGVKDAIEAEQEIIILSP